MKRTTKTLVAVCLASAAVTTALAAGVAEAADSDIFAITTTSSSATITLTPPPLNACNAGVVWKGTGAAPTAQENIAWTDGTALLSYDSALADTFRHRGLAQQFPQYFTKRTVTIALEPGTYTIGGQCTPYDAQGEFVGDDTQHRATFTLNTTTTPSEPGGNNWGSLEGLLP